MLRHPRRDTQEGRAIRRDRMASSMTEEEKPRYRPLHVQIREVLHGRIASAEWPPGNPIPSEIALAAEFEVSTGTIRRALDDLVGQHLIVRHRGRGTFVASHSPHEALYRWFSIEPDSAGVRQFPKDEVVRREAETATADERAALTLAEGESVIRLHRRRLLCGEVMMLDVLILPSSLFEGFAWPEAAGRFTTPYEYYEGMHGVKVIEVVERVKAVAADRQDAAILGVAEGEPLLAVRRIAVTFGDRPVELRLSRVRADRYAYVNRIT
jgi:GntR family transcriptional regulator